MDDSINRMQQRKKTTSSVQEYKNQSVNATFGSRVLENKDDVYNFNAWDHAEWDSDFEQNAKIKLAKQAESPVSEHDSRMYMEDPAHFWTEFYRKNGDTFFQDRKWLAQEFPEVFQLTKPDAGKKILVELGCGAGNTLFPIVHENRNSQLFVHGFDFAESAIEIVRNDPQYNPENTNAQVWDVASDNDAPGLEVGTADIVIAIFVLSALTPNQLSKALTNIKKILKPGGLLLFRDYGRYDMAQLRFRNNRLLSENFYVRGDGTRVYFFDSQELETLFARAGFNVRSNAVDRRLLVNRKTKVKMYRCWLQAKLERPTE